MPVIKSAKKRARQEVVRRDRNYARRKRVRDARKSLAAAQTKGDKKKIAEATSELQSALDTAVKMNILHKNRAARLLSRAIAGTSKPSAKKAAPAKKAVTKKPVAKKKTKTE